jgi:hypothetical protein
MPWRRFWRGAGETLHACLHRNQGTLIKDLAIRPGWMT